MTIGSYGSRNARLMLRWLEQRRDGAQYEKQSGDGRYVPVPALLLHWPGERRLAWPGWRHCHCTSHRSYNRHGDQSGTNRNGAGAGSELCQWCCTVRPSLLCHSDVTVPSQSCQPERHSSFLVVISWTRDLSHRTSVSRFALAQ